MADEHVSGNSPMSTSEATPPHVDDSPESISQPSPPEEARVTSSTDDGAGPSNQEPNQISVLLHTNEATAVEIESPHSISSTTSSVEEAANISNQSSSAPVPEIESQPHLSGPHALSRRDEQNMPIPAIREETVSESMIEVQERLQSEQRKLKEGGQINSEEITKQATKKNVEETSDDSNDQFDVESQSKSSPENVDQESNSSPIGSDVLEERRGSGSAVTDDADIKSSLYPTIILPSGEETSVGIGATENVSLESKLSLPKTDADIPSSGVDIPEKDVLKNELSTSKTSIAIPDSEAGTTTGLKTESSLSKTDPAGVEGGCLISPSPEKEARDNLKSPKRKSPTHPEHLLPKKRSPLQKQSESQMSTLLEDLDIEETNSKPGSSKSTEHEQKSMEIEESKDDQDEEMEQESNMEIQETDSQDAQVETSEEKDDSGMEEAD